MIPRYLADLMVAAHLLWILFMLGGFLVNVWGFFRREIFEWCFFRTLHLCGILCVAFLTVRKKPCPLTLWENALRARYDPEATYPGSFIIHYLEKFVYPDVDPRVIMTLTAVIAVSSLAIFILRPPARIRDLYVKNLKRGAVRT